MTHDRLASSVSEGGAPDPGGVARATGLARLVFMLRVALHRRSTTALLLLIVAALARAQTFNNPVVGFDEQFYLLVGDRLLHGSLPYVDIFDRKPVGLFLIYAAARMLGGGGFLEYKIVALLFVAATAFLLHQITRPRAGTSAAIIASVFYIGWLNFMEGEGGQSPVFYNLLMVGAAALVLRADGARDPFPSGAAAMLLVGLALQVKYSVVLEGLLFGCWLIGLAWRSGRRGWRLCASVGFWVVAALLPTGAAFLVFALKGRGDSFLFANFLSAFSQGRGSAAAQLTGGLVMAVILLPPVLLVATAWRNRPDRRITQHFDAFVLAWTFVAAVAVLAYWRFASPHYAMPLLPPLACLLARAAGSDRLRRRSAAVLVAAGLVGGQAVLAISEHQKGGAVEAAAIAAAASPVGGGCIYVYDGYPALYMLTGSCLPTRWVFPGHLATMDEGNRAAIGVDPVQEVARILASRPVAIVDDLPHFDGGNPATRTVLERALARDYALAACVRTGSKRIRLVYRLRSEGSPSPRCG